MAETLAFIALSNEDSLLNSRARMPNMNMPLAEKKVIQIVGNLQPNSSFIGIMHMPIKVNHTHLTATFNKLINIGI